MLNIFKKKDRPKDAIFFEFKLNEFESFIGPRMVVMLQIKSIRVPGLPNANQGLVH
jgi:hypothetical protein